MKIEKEHLIIGGLLVVGAAWYFWEQSTKDKASDATVAATPATATPATATPTTLPVIAAPVVASSSAAPAAAFASADGEHVFANYVSSQFFKSEPQKVNY